MGCVHLFYKKKKNLNQCLNVCLSVCWIFYANKEFFFKPKKKNFFFLIFFSFFCFCLFLYRSWVVDATVRIIFIIFDKININTRSIIKKKNYFFFKLYLILHTSYVWLCVENQNICKSFEFNYFSYTRFDVFFKFFCCFVSFHTACHLWKCFILFSVVVHLLAAQD